MINPINRIYISGLGAVGCILASKLYQSNPGCLKIIANKDRIVKYKSNGISINGEVYLFSYIQPDEECQPADLILIAVKQHSLEESINDIRRFVGKNTIILSLLNGIVSEEIIADKYGLDKILYSFWVGTDSVREGTNTKFSNIGKIVFGDKTNQTISQNVQAVKDLFDTAKIPYEIPENMIQRLWWKFMMNVGINQVSAILKAPYGVFHNNKDAEDLLKMASNEVVHLSAHTGINLHEHHINDYIKIINTLDPQGKTSMLQDVEAKRKTEVEIFSGTVVELGAKYGVDTPVNNMLLKMIRTMEQTW